MTPAQQVVARKTHFERLYDAFYGYFVDQLRKDASKFSKYRMQLAARYFDDIELQKLIHPLFAEFSTNPGEKQSVASAALYDALVAHTFSGHLAAQDAMLHARIESLEKDAAKGLSALHQLLNQEVEKVRAEVGVVRDSIISKAKELKNDVPKGKQVRKGTQTGDQE